MNDKNEKNDIKSPYGQYTLDEVMEVEAGNYFIQVGVDIFSHDGRMVFSRERAEFFFDKIFRDLTNMKKNGSKEVLSDAEACLFFLKIVPMRLH